MIRAVSRRLAAFLAILPSVHGVCASAKTLPVAPPSVESLFATVKDSPPRLRVFLSAFPKGGDLHNHLWGQPYAEEFLAWAGEGGLCVSKSKLTITPPPCSGDDLLPAKDVVRSDEELYARLIDALSTRGRDQGLGVNDRTGHDDFFETFGRFYLAALASPGPMLASARASAAANQVSYLELIQNPVEVDQAGALAARRTFRPDDFDADLAAIAPDLPALVDAAIARTNAMEADADKRLGCGPTRTGAGADGPCAVVARYQTYVLRSQPPAFVFGQMALGFALAARDPRYVTVNIVAPEDGAVAVADFALHMRMYAYFHARYPDVKLSLHAGELALGLVPPAALADHIRQSIEVAGASRIGHGVDIAYEHDAPGLLAEMARKRVAVEINLTSNDTILGIRGKAHPLALYRAAGVPTMLSTDDEGVSRSDMTNEYLRAVTEQGLGYADLKEMARASLEYAFLPGESLWATGRIGQKISACMAADPSNLQGPDAACARILAGSEKARAQWRLEAEFAQFEQKVVSLTF